MKKRTWLAILTSASLLPLASCGGEISSSENYFNVTLNNGEGYTLVGENSVKEGGTYSFSVTLLEGYETSSTFTVSVNGETLSSDDLTYNVENVSGDLTVTVTGVTKKSFAVTFVPKEGITYSGESKVLYGDDYSFSLEVTTVGFENKGVIVKENGESKPFSENEGIYTVKDVKGNLTIEALDPERKFFLVDLDFDESHYDFVGAKEAIVGEDYSFTIALKDGFEKTKDFGFYINSEETLFESGKTYTIKNVSKGVHIEAFGEDVIQLNVSFTSDVPGAIKNTTDKLPYFRETFSFNIELSDRYSESKDIKVYLSLDGKETLLTSNEDGSFSIKNPKKDFEIIVKGATVNTRTISFYNGETLVYSETVEEGSNITDETYTKAKEAFNKTLTNGDRLEAWDKEVTVINENVSLNGIVASPITSEEDFKAMQNDKHYYLANDLDIAKPINMDFAGYLNGDNHRILLLKDSNLGWADGVNNGVIFKEFSGTVKNLKVDAIISHVNIRCASIAGRMTAGSISNVEARVIYQSFSYGYSGGLVGKVEGGELKDSKIYFVSQDYDSSNQTVENLLPIAASYSGGTIENIEVILPAAVPTTKLSLVKEIAGGLSLKNCTIKTIDHVLFESPLANPTSVTETFLGLPLTKMDLLNGTGTAFLRDLDLNNEKILRFSFYIRCNDYLYDGNDAQDTLGFDSGGYTKLTASPSDCSIWNYVEFVRDGSDFIVTVSNFVNKHLIDDLIHKPDGSNSIYASLTYRSIRWNKVEPVIGPFYAWGEKSKLTAYATPVYAEMKA